MHLLGALGKRSLAILLAQFINVVDILTDIPIIDYIFTFFQIRIIRLLTVASRRMDASQSPTPAMSEPSQSLKDVYGNLAVGENWTSCYVSARSTLNTPDKLGFDQILRTEQQIEHIKERLQSGKISRQKKLKARCKMQVLEEHLVKLRRCHDEVARKLKVRAMTLAILPREMRDAIFEQLYVRDTAALEMGWSRVGDKTVFEMPKDESLYLSQLHVGAEVASEAADIFYKHNSFAFSTGRTPSWMPWSPRSSTLTMNWKKKTFEKWWDCDHYGSGVVPRDLVRKLSLRMQSPVEDGFHSIPTIYDPTIVAQLSNHLSFETQYTNFQDFSSHLPSGNLWDHRGQLQYLLTLDSLQEVHLVIPVEPGYADQLLRLMCPYVRQLRGKKIKVFVECTFQMGESKDVSHLFDAPSPEDRIQFEQIAGRPLHRISDEEKDPVAIWWALSQERHRASYDLQVVEPAFVRSWLEEHFHAFKFYQAHRALIEELDRIKADVGLLDPEARRIRRDNYARLIDLMPPYRL